MLVLSKREIERIGNDIIADFFRVTGQSIRNIDIEALASDYLGLKQVYTKLSDNGKMLGLTTFRGIKLELQRNGGIDSIILPEDTILLEERLREKGTKGCRRFTIGHECGHQILYRMEEKQGHFDVHTRFRSGQAYSCRELKTVSDWYEWQANALGAVLLMPEELVRHTMKLFGYEGKLRVYRWGRLEMYDHHFIQAMTEYLGVSKTALIVRLRELGMVDDRPDDEYRYHPLDVIMTTVGKGQTD